MKTTLSRRIGSCALASILAISMASGLVSATPDEAQAATVKMSAKAKTLTVGKTYTLKVKGTKAKVKWSSTNKKVATVSTKGKVKAKKMGTATIKAKVGKKTYTCKVTVKPKINASKKTVNVGKTYKLKLTGAVGTVKWSSSNKKVATIGASTGTVKGIKAGTATITAKIKNKKVATCKVTVKKVAASNETSNAGSNSGSGSTNSGTNTTTPTAPTTPNKPGTTAPVITPGTQKVTLYDQNGKVIDYWQKASLARTDFELMLNALNTKPELKVRAGQYDWDHLIGADKCPKGIYIDKACTTPLTNANSIQNGQSLYLKLGTHSMKTMLKYKDVRVENAKYSYIQNGSLAITAITNPNDRYANHLLTYDFSTFEWTDQGDSAYITTMPGSTRTSFLCYFPMKYVACYDCGYDQKCLSNYHAYLRPNIDPTCTSFSIYRDSNDTANLIAAKDQLTLSGEPTAVWPAGYILERENPNYCYDFRKILGLNI